MKYLVIVSLLAIAPQLSFARTTHRNSNSFASQDPCIKAAISQTEKEFPVRQKVNGRFFQWFSGTQSGWTSFSRIENLGAENADYVSHEQVAHVINTNLFAPADAARKIALLNAIQGKTLLTVQFLFSDSCDLLRYFSVESSGAGGCQVRHLDTQLDDFDNG